MYRIIKDKGKTINAYQLGCDNAVIKGLMENGKICYLGNDEYEIYSQEVANGGAGGERAMAGDWIKVDSSGNPYPNTKEFFEANHRHLGGDTFEQLPKPLPAWDAKLEMCPEVEFLVANKGLVIDETSSDRRYMAPLWGSTEAAAEDAMIVFYNISYDETGSIRDCDWNFVEKSEFEKTYTVIGQTGSDEDDV